MRCVIAAICVAAALPASAQMTGGSDKSAGGADAAARFGAREGIEQISQSPDGTHVAIIVPTKGPGAAVLVADLVKGGPPKPVCRPPVIPTA